MINYPKRGEVWMLQKNLATGSEQTNDRPVIIVSNDKNNYFSPNVTIVPMTAKKKKDLPTHVSISTSTVFGTALCEQVCVASKLRLIKKLNEVSDKDLHSIEKAIKIQCGMEE